MNTLFTTSHLPLPLYLLPYCSLLPYSLIIIVTHTYLYLYLYIQSVVSSVFLFVHVFRADCLQLDKLSGGLSREKSDFPSLSIINCQKLFIQAWNLAFFPHSCWLVKLESELMVLETEKQNSMVLASGRSHTIETQHVSCVSKGCIDFIFMCRTWIQQDRFGTYDL